MRFIRFRIQDSCICLYLEFNINAVAVPRQIQVTMSERVPELGRGCAGRPSAQSTMFCLFNSPKRLSLAARTRTGARNGDRCIGRLAVFYARTKGELERDVQAIGFQSGCAGCQSGLKRFNRATHTALRRTGRRRCSPLIGGTQDSHPYPRRYANRVAKGDREPLIAPRDRNWG